MKRLLVAASMQGSPRRTLLGLLLVAAVAQSLAPHIHRLERLGASVCCDEHYSVAPSLPSGPPSHGALHAGDCLVCRSSFQLRVAIGSRHGPATPQPAILNARVAAFVRPVAAPDPVRGPAPPRAPPV